MTTTTTSHTVTVTATRSDSGVEAHLQVGDVHHRFRFPAAYPSMSDAEAEAWGVQSAIASITSCLWSRCAEFDALRRGMTPHLAELLRAERDLIGHDTLDDAEVALRSSEILGG